MIVCYPMLFLECGWRVDRRYTPEVVFVMEYIFQTHFPNIEKHKIKNDGASFVIYLFAYVNVSIISIGLYVFNYFVTHYKIQQIFTKVVDDITVLDLCVYILIHYVCSIYSFLKSQVLSHFFKIVQRTYFTFPLLDIVSFLTAAKILIINFGLNGVQKL